MLGVGGICFRPVRKFALLGPFCLWMGKVWSPWLILESYCELSSTDSMGPGVQGGPQMGAHSCDRTVRVLNLAWL